MVRHLVLLLLKTNSDTLSAQTMSSGSGSGFQSVVDGEGFPSIGSQIPDTSGSQNPESATGNQRPERNRDPPNKPEVKILRKSNASRFPLPPLDAEISSPLIMKDAGKKPFRIHLDANNGESLSSNVNDRRFIDNTNHCCSYSILSSIPSIVVDRNIPERNVYCENFLFGTQSANERGKAKPPSLKPSFRIPSRYLLCDQEKGKKAKEPKSRVFRQININLWDEFYYGVSVLDTKEKRRMATFSSAIITIFGGFIPEKHLINIIYLVYFLLYFLTCLIYNYVSKLCSYYLIIQHFRIHEIAYSRRLKIHFSENSFEGPYNAYLRQIWCAHCTQAMNEKIILKLMKEYRAEIVRNQLHS